MLNKIIKPKMCSVKSCRKDFYEAMEEGSTEEMADYFETLYWHYQERGRKIKNFSR